MPETNAPACLAEASPSAPTSPSQGANTWPQPPDRALACAVCGEPIEADPWGSPGIWPHEDRETDGDGHDADRVHPPYPEEEGDA